MPGLLLASLTRLLLLQWPPVDPCQQKGFTGCMISLYIKLRIQLSWGWFDLETNYLETPNP